jgi:hypothetical protein
MIVDCQPLIWNILDRLGVVHFCIRIIFEFCLPILRIAKPIDTESRRWLPGRGGGKMWS